MITEEEKEILHRAGEILNRECSSVKMCENCPRDIYNACQNIDAHEDFDVIGVVLQEI